MNIGTTPEEVIILSPETDPFIWQEFDPLVYALIEQDGVVIDVTYSDEEACELAAVRRVWRDDE